MRKFAAVAAASAAVALALMLCVPAFAYAGVMEYAKAVAGAKSLWIGIVTVILLYVLKRVPNEKIYTFVEKWCKKAGVVVTFGLNGWKYTAPFWEQYVEPWAIDALENTIGAATNGFITGLRSNNKTDK